MSSSVSHGKKIIIIIAVVALLSGLAAGAYFVYQSFFAEPVSTETEEEPQVETQEVIVDPDPDNSNSLNELNNFADENRPDQETEFVPDPDDAGIAN